MVAEGKVPLLARCWEGFLRKGIMELLTCPKCGFRLVTYRSAVRAWLCHGSGCDFTSKERPYVMNIADSNYRSLIEATLQDGEEVTTRNSRVKRVFGYVRKFRSTPLVSIRKTSWRNALREWQWFMSGSCNINALHPSVHHWWQPWTDENGNVLFNYSQQFRAMSAIDPDTGMPSEFDQVEYLIEGIKEHPFSRRNAITTWNTPEMAHPRCPITNCHNSYTQLVVSPDSKLHLFTVQRSVDVICGLPHNLIQCWAFLMWLAHRGGREVGSLQWVGVDVHIYETHFPLAEKMLQVTPPEETPQLVYTPTSEDFLADDFTLSGPYNPILTDKAEMVV